MGVSRSATQSPAGFANLHLQRAGLVARLLDQGYRYALSPAELELELTLEEVTLGFDPGDPRRYGALGDGSTDDSEAFQVAADLSGSHPLVIDGTLESHYIIDTPIEFPADAHVQIRGNGRPLLESTVAGSHIFQGVGLASVSLHGVRFKGAGSGDMPLTEIDGVAASATGLVHFSDCDDVEIYRCHASHFRNGIVAYKCRDVDIQRCNVQNYLFCGILTTLSARFTVDHNIVKNCDQDGATVAYAITATGDEAGGSTLEDCSISFNRINGVPSWDGIMTHDCSGLTITGNNIRNVRTGIDVGHLDNTNLLRDITITANTIVATASDTYEGAGASHSGINVSGYDSTHTVDGVTITGNRIRGFFTVSGLLSAGTGNGHIVIAHAINAAVAGNSITMGGAATTTNAAIYLEGEASNFNIVANACRGEFTGGGIRLASVNADVGTINANNIRQTDTADAAVVATNSTVAALSLGDNPSNADEKFTQSTSTIGFSATLLELFFSTTVDPVELVAGGDYATGSLSAAGVSQGDFVLASFSVSLQHVDIEAFCGDGVINYKFINHSDTTRNLDEGTLRFKVLKALH